MAIYHLTANVISRARGQSMVAVAAYRLGAALRDQRYGVTHNYVGKRGVTHSEIMAPAVAPHWAHDREALWNTVEASESRKDSQLARLIEVGLPIELSGDERVALVRGASRWLSMTPEQRSSAQQRFGQWRSMPPEQRQELRNRWQQYKSLPPEQQQHVRQSFQRFRQMPPEQRSELRKQWRQMSPEQRRSVRQAPPPRAPPPRTH